MADQLIIGLARFGVTGRLDEGKVRECRKSFQLLTFIWLMISDCRQLSILVTQA
jgi:hypothetical protein